jgi:disulfide oxidoreductase YuzD
MKEGYIKRKTSTIPFGYETSDVKGYFKPVPKQIHALEVVSKMVHGDEISLAVAVDWLEASTDRKLSRMGLKKHIDKKYERQEEDDRNKFNSILDRF